MFVWFVFINCSSGCNKVQPNSILSIAPLVATSYNQTVFGEKWLLCDASYSQRKIKAKDSPKMQPLKVLSGLK